MIYNATINTAAPLWVAYIIYTFHFNLASTYTPKILKVALGFALQP